MNTGESSPPEARSTFPFDRLSRDGQSSFRKIGGERVGSPFAVLSMPPEVAPIELHASDSPGRCMAQSCSMLAMK
jgi:hypothetical protein